MKTVSAGIIILNKDNQILACKPFGKFDGRCDIPKGKIEDGELPYEAALRETFEETGLDLKDVELEEIGLLTYQPKKDLYLFKCIYEIEDLSVLHCDSMFKLNDCFFPEVDGYEWLDLTVENLDRRFYRSLGPVLKEVLKIV